MLVVTDAKAMGFTFREVTAPRGRLKRGYLKDDGDDGAAGEKRPSTRRPNLTCEMAGTRDQGDRFEV